MECAYCGERATSTDHVVPRALGGSDEPSNLVPACQPCNSQKGAQTGTVAPCGRMTFGRRHCHHVTCLPCAPAQIDDLTQETALVLAGLMTRWFTRKRDRLIVKARAEGLSLRAVAARAGLSHTQVKNIAKRDNIEA